MTIWTACLMGLLATAFMDLAQCLRTHLAHAPGLDYRLVGRWLLGLRTGPNTAPLTPITQRPAQAGERALGWAAHYGVGAAMGALLPVAQAWAPSLPRGALCLGIGVVSMALPTLLMQPGMGLGVAASRTPAPWRARRGTLFAHLSYGLGLWLAWALLDGLARIP